MPKPISFGSVQVGLTAGSMPVSGELAPDTPFRILVMGDFSGRASRGGPVGVPGDRKPTRVDRDNFDQVLNKLGVEVHLPTGEGTRFPIHLSELDDFHPDHLFQRVEVFQELRDLRRRLGNTSTFAQAAEEMRGWAREKKEKPSPADSGGGSPPLAESGSASDRPGVVDPDNLLEQILGSTQSQARDEGPGGPVNWNRFMQQIVAPHLVPSIDYTRQAELVAMVDEATSRQMAAILHQPEFQAIEAAWQGLNFLNRRLDTDGPLQLWILDVTKAELAADLMATDDLDRTRTYRWLVEQPLGSPGGHPWAVIAGVYEFDAVAEDVALLGRLARIAQPAGAPFLAGASTRIFGCASLAGSAEPSDWPAPDTEREVAWEVLRRLPEASSLGLAVPRFLLRLPYGKKTVSMEQFDFEEMPEVPRHEWFLWGNPAIACVYLLGVAFGHRGWDFRPGMVQDIEGLPAYTCDDDGEPQVKPGAEVVLVDRAAHRIADKGLMVLRSFAGGDAVRLAEFHSIANPTRPLAGRWQSA